MGSDSIDMKLRVKLYSTESKRGRRDYCLFPPSPFEVKTSATAVRKDYSGFDALSEDTGKQFVRGIVLYMGEQSVSFGENFRHRRSL